MIPSYQEGLKEWRVVTEFMGAAKLTIVIHVAISMASQNIRPCTRVGTHSGIKVTKDNPTFSWGGLLNSGAQLTVEWFLYIWIRSQHRGISGYDCNWATVCVQAQWGGWPWFCQVRGVPGSTYFVDPGSTFNQPITSLWCHPCVPTQIPSVHFESSLPTFLGWPTKGKLFCLSSFFHPLPN